MRILALVLLNLIFWTLPVQAADILAELTAASRTVDWTNNAGIPGGIPARPNICQTLGTAGQPVTFVQSVTAAQIRTALVNCASTPGRTVFLNAGRYNLASGIDFTDVQQTTLRGAGAHLTKLVFSGATGCYYSSAVALGECADVVFITTSGSSYHTNWTAGFARGTTDITVASGTGITVGQMIILDQLQDYSDTGGVISSNCPASNGASCGAFKVNNESSASWGRGVCNPSCSGAWGDRPQQQVVRVTAKNGNVISITPGLYHTNWRIGQVPQAYYPSTHMGYLQGLEDMTIDTTFDGAAAGVQLFNCYGCWVKGVRSLSGTSQAQHFFIIQSARSEVRNSYMYGFSGSNTTNYGMVPLISSDILYLNNIGERIAGAVTTSTSSGSVFAYNYANNLQYNTGSSWQQSSLQNHGADSYILSEGNDVNTHLSDNLHGASPFLTDLRNYYYGVESDIRSGNTTPIHPEAFRRGSNLIGNILGTTGYHTNYQVGASGNPCGETIGSEISIYSMGYPGNFTGCTGGVVTVHDGLTVTTMVRWGNCDAVTGFGNCRFVSGEVAPAGALTYMPAVAVPSTQTIPSTFFLNSTDRAAWWGTPYGTVPFPPIGPDVTGGNGTDKNGVVNTHVNKIPARLCWEHMTDDPSYASPNNVRQFNASTCYQSISGDKVPPAPPTNLKIF